MELKITKEKVLEAASKCSTAKATLETLFPECFVEKLEYLVYTTDDLQNYLKNSIAAYLYNKIPGENVEKKAATVHNLIVKTYVK